MSKLFPGRRPGSAASGQFRTFGPIFLAFIALIMLVSLVLIAWRSDRLHAPGSLDAVVSRESTFILNNLLFVAFTFTVLLGTTFPLIVEAFNGSRVSVGPPLFCSGPSSGAALVSGKLHVPSLSRLLPSDVIQSKQSSPKFPATIVLFSRLSSSWPS